MLLGTVVAVAYDDQFIWIIRTVHNTNVRTPDNFVGVYVAWAVGAPELLPSIMFTELVLLVRVIVFIYNTAPFTYTPVYFGVMAYHRLCICSLSFD